MDFGALIEESIEYSREALAGTWTTWLVFVICSLPMALIQFLFDPTTLVDKASGTMHWDLIPWPQIIALIVAGFLLSFITSGYLVRVYRGTTPPPVFDQWASLYLDAIKLLVVSILWFVPPAILLAAALAVAFLGIAGGSSSLVPGLVVIVLLLAAFIILIVVSLYSALGVIRFARTGSIREGIRFSAISKTIGRIGWMTYIIALIVQSVVWFIFFIVVMMLSFIPFIGWLISLAVTPLYTVFDARFMSRVYDHGISEVLVTAPGNTP
jgi:hypothetical protein